MTLVASVGKEQLCLMKGCNCGASEIESQTRKSGLHSFILDILDPSEHMRMCNWMSSIQPYASFAWMICWTSSLIQL